METKLSKILNKLIDNDDSLRQDIQQNSSSINKLESDCGVLSSSIEKLSGLSNCDCSHDGSNQVDLTEINNKISGIINALSGYTTPNAISAQFKSIEKELNKIVNSGSDSGNSLSVADNSYILINDNNEIYLDIDSINENIENKINEYDNSLSEIYDRLCNLE